MFTFEICSCYNLVGWSVGLYKQFVRLEFLPIQQGLLSTSSFNTKHGFYLKDENRYVHRKLNPLDAKSYVVSVGEMSHLV